jgi:hypothetical protein
MTQPRLTKTQITYLRASVQRLSRSPAKEIPEQFLVWANANVDPVLEDGENARFVRAELAFPLVWLFVKFSGCTAEQVIQTMRIALLRSIFNAKVADRDLLTLDDAFTALETISKECQRLGAARQIKEKDAQS